jgi:hypothetical protein
MDASYRDVFDSSNDPKLPFSIILSRDGSDAFGKSLPKGKGMLVLCGQCASCSLKSFDAKGAAKALDGKGYLILVYETAPREIKHQFAKVLRPSNLFVIADEQGTLTETLNGGFAYRHISGTLDKSQFVALKLQKLGQPDQEFAL